MSALQVIAPNALHLGWDIQFTRIAQHAGPRIVGTLYELAQACVEQGLNAHIQHRLAETSTYSSLCLSRLQGELVLELRFTLQDGWVQDHQHGARLDVELFTGPEAEPAALTLRRFYRRYSADPGEVYYNAGDLTRASLLWPTLHQHF